MCIMYNKCPICESKRFIKEGFRQFVCPYCRGTGNDICPQWPLERKQQMLNLIRNKPLHVNVEHTMHVPTSHLNTMSKQRGRPKKSA
jgi:hypothetical protein